MIMLEAVTVQEEVMPVARYLNTTEAAERLSVTNRTIARWIELGYFPGSIKVNPHAKNSTFLIPLDAIEAFELRRQSGDGSDK